MDTRVCSNVRSLGIGAPGMYYTMTFSIDGDGEKIYDNGSWRSAEHVHLSTGCESMSHGADDKRCPYHAPAPSGRSDRTPGTQVGGDATSDAGGDHMVARDRHT